MPAVLPIPSPGVDINSEEYRRYLLSLENAIAGQVAPVDAQYWVSTSNGDLTNDRNIGALTTGYLKIATTLGVATPSTVATIPVADIAGLSTTTAYGAGAAYAFTNTAAAIDFGTTDPAITLSAAGTYLLFGQVNLAYTGATVVAETATIKVRRTNNTAADLSAVVVLDLPVATTLTHTYGIFQIPPFAYTTSATNDAITVFGNVSAALGAGTIDATAVGTSLVALRIA